MRQLRLIITAVIVAMAFLGSIAGPASASRPEKERFSFSDSIDFGAGDLCDFAYHQEFSFDGTGLTYFDQTGEVVRDTVHATVAVTHVNEDTGYTLTEIDTVNQTIYWSRGTGKVVGIQWHLRDPDGKIVLTVAGLVTFQLDPFEIIRITPRVDQFFDFPEVICPLLGGSPA